VKFAHPTLVSLMSFLLPIEMTDPEIAAAIKHIVEPANEQNLNRWQAEVSETEI
jgi:hypothetical protein